MLNILAFIVRKKKGTLVTKGQTIWREEEGEQQVQTGGHVVTQSKDVIVKKKSAGEKKTDLTHLQKV